MAAVAALRGDCHGCEAGDRLLGVREEGVEGMALGSERKCLGCWGAWTRTWTSWL